MIKPDMTPATMTQHRRENNCRVILTPSILTACLVRKGCRRQFHLILKRSIGKFEVVLGGTDNTHASL